MSTAPLPRWVRCCALAAAALAGRAAQASADTPACMEVEVGGQRAPPSVECLTQKLAPPARPSEPADRGAALASEAIVQRPSNQLGLFNRAATGHRMGNQLGHSAFPQRPPDAPDARPPVPVAPRP